VKDANAADYANERDSRRDGTIYALATARSIASPSKHCFERVLSG